MLPQKVMTVRIPRHLSARFDMLKKQFSGLPPATLTRLILCNFLRQPIEQQAHAILGQIHGPGKPG